MFWALAVILLAFAAFTVIVVRLRRSVRAIDHTHEDDGAGNPARRIDLEQLRGLCTSAPVHWHSLRSP